MTKNKGKGGKGHRKAKSNADTIRKRDLLVKEEGQEYATVTKILGGCHFECLCADAVTRLGHIRGKMRKRTWIGTGDIVLCGLRDYEDGKVDIFHKYDAGEIQLLKSMHQLPSCLIQEEYDPSSVRDQDDDYDTPVTLNDETTTTTTDIDFSDAFIDAI